ncbi:Sorting nexin-2 [Portunus trituberculatus]|uniref:Sorting nexin-2 n=1 Tax=Portunus trituberculatus TaxID=210409 RepID=A0A5B7D378_PORTR|nr:Sorting nexin-2 [Portunus trituberculatus]
MRRFSDFLGLHRKLVEKHLHSGRVIPPAPEKSAIGTTKIKLGSDKNADSGSLDFIERRRAALERYMNRTSAHPTLRADPDFREFIELDAELPRATQTSALSSAGVLRLFNRVGETVNKMTFKMDESDQWFEERTQQIESLDAQLRKLHASMEGLVNYRRELALSTAAFAKATAVLSSVEEHSSLSRALHQLSESTERTQTIHHAQADADFYVLSENTKDYIQLIAAVKDVFHERVKTFQTWQHAQITLAKKREAKAKAELAGRMDKVQQAQEEVTEWEGKVERSQEEFERISRAIKKEMEQFDVMRVKDFRDMVIKYLEDLMTSQQQVGFLCCCSCTPVILLKVCVVLRSSRCGRRLSRKPRPSPKELPGARGERPVYACVGCSPSPFSAWGEPPSPPGPGLGCDGAAPSPFLRQRHGPH